MNKRVHRSAIHPFPDVEYGDDLSGTFIAGALDDRFPAFPNTEKKLVLVHTGRCGSTLLHNRLLSAGICPPFEIFNPDTISEFVKTLDQDRPYRLADYVFEFRKSILEDRVNDHECVVSYSVTPWALDWLIKNAPQITSWLFKDALLVFLTRRNILKQALSYALASKTGRWHSHIALPDDNREVSWNEHAIKHLDLILWGENQLGSERFKKFLNLSNRQISLNYESLIEDLDEIAELIFLELRIKESAKIRIKSVPQPVRLSKQNRLYEELLESTPILLPSSYVFRREMLFLRMAGELIETSNTGNDYLFGHEDYEMPNYHVVISNRKEQHRVFGLTCFRTDLSEVIHLGIKRLRVRVANLSREFDINELIDCGVEGGATSICFSLITQMLENGETQVYVEKVHESNANAGGLVGTNVLARYDVIVDNRGSLSTEVKNSLTSANCNPIVGAILDSTMFPYETVNELRAPEPFFKKMFSFGGRSQSDQRWRKEIETLSRDGYVVLNEMIPSDICDAFVAEVKAEVAAGRINYQWGSSERIHHTHKLPTGSKIWKNPAVTGLLREWFKDDPVACQTLFYFFGSQQSAHQDTIHLTSFPAGYMCGVWVALEDVTEDSGELFVYKGSHKLPRIYSSQLGLPKVRTDYSHYKKFDDEISRMITENSFEKVVYRPKKGQILVWHENLLHGGSPRGSSNKTRVSVVSHYFSRGSIAYYDSRGEAADLEELF